jgi:hypothetical protein
VSANLHCDRTKRSGAGHRARGQASTSQFAVFQGQLRSVRKGFGVGSAAEDHSLLDSFSIRLEPGKATGLTRRRSMRPGAEERNSIA